MEEASNKKKKNKKKKITKSQFRMKILKFLLLILLILSVITIFFERYLNEQKSIYEKIGSMSLTSISLKDALNIEGYGLNIYINMIKSGSFESAYNMLTEEYRNYMTYDEYLESIEGIDFETFEMKQIKIKTEGTYVATVLYEKNEELVETQYLLYLNEINPQIITISPEKFIYSFHDLNFKMDNIKLNLQECNIYTDNITLKATIKNTSWFETMTFTDVGTGYNDVANKSQKNEFILAPGEEKEIDITYDTNYYVPNNIKLKRKLDDDTVRTYTFYFENEK